MSLPRKDVRLKLDHDIHAAVKALADVQGEEPAEWVEKIIVGIVTKRINEANLVITQLRESGALGTFGDAKGTT